MNHSQFRVDLVTWADQKAALQAVRRWVFIDEQRVPEAEEWDNADAVCLHALATSLSGEAIGTARLLSDGHIGRMAVVQSWRGKGVGSALLGTMIEAGRARGDSVFFVNAQTHALPFYERFGFVAHGQAFLDAGIPHRAMTLWL